jgi:hypothetical protein
MDSSPNSENNKVNVEPNMSMSRDQLVEICKQRGIVCTGTKQVLIDNIKNNRVKRKISDVTQPSAKGEKKQKLVQSKLIKDEKNTTESTGEVIKTSSKPKPKPKEKPEPAVKQVFKRFDKLTIELEHSKSGNVVHRKSGLVFDPDTLFVNARESDDGTLLTLTEADIELCKKFKFRYEIPFSLDETVVKNVSALVSEEVDDTLFDDADDEMCINDDI